MHTSTHTYALLDCPGDNIYNGKDFVLAKVFVLFLNLLESLLEIYLDVCSSKLNYFPVTLFEGGNNDKFKKKSNL